jgi:hypothetical protein
MVRVPDQSCDDELGGNPGAPERRTSCGQEIEACRCYDTHASLGLHFRREIDFFPQILAENCVSIWREKQ